MSRSSITQRRKPLQECCIGVTDIICAPCICCCPCVRDCIKSIRDCLCCPCDAMVEICECFCPCCCKPAQATRNSGVMAPPVRSMSSGTLRQSSQGQLMVQPTSPIPTLNGVPLIQVVSDQGQIIYMPPPTSESLAPTQIQMQRQSMN